MAGPDGTKAAVFKPEDEEPGAAHNPRGWVGGAASPTAQQGLRRGSLAGEGAARELAAYVLDHGGFANVPATAMVTCSATECGRWAKVEGPGDRFLWHARRPLQTLHEFMDGPCRPLIILVQDY